MTSATIALPRPLASETTRWGQLIFGIICMVMIANLQYGWTLFVNPIDQKYHWGRAAIQVAFTIFVLTETWLVPLEGYLIDKFGPRVMIAGSGVLVAIAWVINSVADSLFLLYVGAAIGGIGAGVIYGGSVGNALKWFPDRRGLAAGLTAAGFGAGSALTVIPIANMIQSSGYQSAFLWFGLGQGIVVVLVALFLRAPEPGEVNAPAAPAVAQSKRDYGPGEVLRTPVFWVMYAMFVMVGAGGLMATAQLAPIAKDFNVGGIPVSILGITLPALTFALSIDRVLNGFCRPFFGWVSDNIGREKGIKDGDRQRPRLQGKNLARGEIGGARRGGSKEEDQHPGEGLSPGGERVEAEGDRGSNEQDAADSIGRGDHGPPADGVEETPEQERPEEIARCEGDQMRSGALAGNPMIAHQHQGIGEEDRELAETARARLRTGFLKVPDQRCTASATLGYDNIEVRVGVAAVEHHEPHGELSGARFVVLRTTNLPDLVWRYGVQISV
jgi:oxalate/formate antiporter